MSDSIINIDLEESADGILGEGDDNDIVNLRVKDPFESDSQTNEVTGSIDLDTSIQSGSNVELVEESTSKKDVYYVKIQQVESKETCMMCKTMKIVKYNCTFNNNKLYICHDKCLEKLQGYKSDVVLQEYFNKFYCPVQIDSNYKYSRLCRQCGLSLKNAMGVCSWEAMDYCNEQCLYRYQSRYAIGCAECNAPVAYTQLGKYSVRFGCIIRQFCCGVCLEKKKKKIKICSYCQKSITKSRTLIGNKFFCHEICKGMFEYLQKPKKPPFLINPDDVSCYVCKVVKPIQIEFDYHHSIFYFCSNGCFTIFKFIQNCEPPPKKCHSCNKYVLQQYLESNALFYDNSLHYFCSNTCQDIYIITHRRVVPCVWCKVKKYNFDMIQKNDFLGNSVFSCSLYCINQLKRSIDSIINKDTCHYCNKEVGIYELKMASGVIQNFCSNNCISDFRSQIQPAIQTAKRVTRGRQKQVIPDKPGPLPIITNVCSLAPNAKSKNIETSVKKILIVKSPPNIEQQNISTSVEPLKSDKDCQYEVDTVNEEIQTNPSEKGIPVSPIMVPIYVPTPMQFWNAPIPAPVPFPLVIPCPILIPLTKNSSNGIMNEIKNFQLKAPTDPFEAELLMMAELVAEKKETSNHVENEEYENTGDEIYSPEPADTSNTFGDDMLQIALKLASDYEEPAVDLEGALTANTITPSQQQISTNIESEEIDSLQIQNMLNRQSLKLRKRGVRQTRQNPSRKGRRPAHLDISLIQPESSQPVEHIEKPDAHMCLKYTFGVNAWKQWVTTKNVELERSSRRLKLFKTELLQLSSDELNYSLCLFVKEVRKPNGSEYAPDTIYYLCLGIQQYLYENGRIDNIFCDPYYEKFTGCLDEVCRKFSILYNDSHYIVTRVEEEHLWESKQLGAHSPHVLLSTLMFFNTKHFNLTSVDEHMQLSFSHIMKHWKRHPNQAGTVKQPSRNVLLRFYPPQSSLDGNSRKKKVYEQQENGEDPLRCPVKLYEFYLSKCPESVKTRNDVFYLLPERSCVPDSPVWYSTMALDRTTLEKMLHRVKMVKEINVALLAN